jgi:hypothetical protein
MNLDPVDIFGETIGEPLKRVAVYFLGIVGGGWMGEIALNIDHGHWMVLGWNDFISGFMTPLSLLATSAAPLVVIGLLYFVLTPWRLDWSLLPVMVGSAAFSLVDRDAFVGWIAWAVLSIGLSGTIWIWGTYQKARWAKELSELRAYNSMQATIREKEREEAVRIGEKEYPP